MEGTSQGSWEWLSKKKKEVLVFYVLAWELQARRMVHWQICFIWPTLMKKIHELLPCHLGGEFI